MPPIKMPLTSQDKIEAAVLPSETPQQHEEKQSDTKCDDPCILSQFIKRVENRIRSSGISTQVR